jgi:hypothetical protein
MSNAFNIKRTATNGNGVSLNSVAHPKPTSKIDVIIDALSVAQNSVWSALNQEALAYAVELKTELAKPEQSHYSDIVSNGGLDPRNKFDAPQRKEWVGLSVNEGRDFFESKLTRAELITEISEFLEEKNT